MSLQPVSSYECPECLDAVKLARVTGDEEWPEVLLEQRLVL